jgi:GTP diphosphokinase / guanosine-3',5'-bis(diphosphate) 3'-diphosphatase
MIRQYELVDRVLSYDPNADEDKLNKAYVFAMKAHGAQKRASGDPYFSHPLEVAGLLADLKLDSSTIITALLHDTVEDTSATLDEIEDLFGEEIARLVDGVTKLTRIELKSDVAHQAENFRKLVLAMSEDIRVLLVKLADRLHNMRTLHYIKNPDKRLRIAVETQEIYVPLADRIGIHQIKDELEDLAFAQIQPEARESIVKRLKYLRSKGENLIPNVIEQLTDLFIKEGVEVEVTGREKTPFSIWKKMQRKNVQFEELCDIVAFRILVDNVDDCYRILGALHSHYPVLPGRFKDYISTPKPNNYRSLHTSIIGPDRHRIEVQIKTKEMHEIAEWGVAAHWLYKEGDKSPKSDSGVIESRNYRWLRELVSILEQASGAEEFLEHTKLEMFQDQVFCFTPKGDLYELPKGATSVDFAYAIHSQVGDRCVGARVNSRLVPLKTEIQNGDQIEVITSASQTPSPDWENFVVTGKAKACIRRFIRSEKRTQFVELGRAMVQRAFRQADFPFTEKSLEEILPQFNIKSVEDLYAQVGEGLQSVQPVIHAVFPHKKEVTSLEEQVAHTTQQHKKEKKKNTGYAIPIKGLIPGMAMHYAGCCHPLPGDRIVGIVATGRGVTIHTIDCDNLEKFSEEPDRWIDVAWDVETSPDEKFIGRMNIILQNKPGSLGSVTTIVGKNDGNIMNLKITNRKADYFEIIMDIEIKDLRHLNNLMAALRSSPDVIGIERSRG